MTIDRDWLRRQDFGLHVSTPDSRRESYRWRNATALVVLVGLALFLAFCGALANAQERMLSSKPMGFFGVGHEQFHQHYMGLVNGVGGSCCNGSDGRPTQARWNGETWDIMVDGVWRSMRPSESYKVLTPEVLKKQGRERFDNQAHVFTSKTGNLIWCVIPPASGG